MKEKTFSIRIYAWLLVFIMIFSMVPVKVKANIENLDFPVNAKEAFKILNIPIDKIGMELKLEGKEAKYTSELSGLDYYLWFLANQEDNKSKVKEAIGKSKVDTYEDLNNFKKVELPTYSKEDIKKSILSGKSNSSNIKIETVLQKYVNDKWIEINKTVVNNSNDDLSGNIKLPSTVNKTEKYRLIKNIYADDKLVLQFDQNNIAIIDNTPDREFYKAKVSMIKTFDGSLSMGDAGFKNNREVLVEKNKDDYFVTIGFNPIEIANIRAGIDRILSKDNNMENLEVKYLNIIDANGKETEERYVSRIKFKTNDPSQKFLVGMYIPKGMGDTEVSAFIVIDWENKNKIDNPNKEFFKVKVELKNQYTEEKSMGDAAFNTNREALVVKEKNKYTISVKPTYLTIGNLSAGIASIESADDRLYNVKTTEDKLPPITDNASIDNFPNYISKIVFDTDAKYDDFMLKITVPRAMGEYPQKARLVFDWANMAELKDENEIKSLFENLSNKENESNESNEESSTEGDSPSATKLTYNIRDKKEITKAIIPTVKKQKAIVKKPRIKLSARKRIKRASKKVKSLNKVSQISTIDNATDDDMSQIYTVTEGDRVYKKSSNNEVYLWIPIGIVSTIAGSIILYTIIIK